jgi:DNA-directed RNA polymerase specialized sigma subunit
MQESKRHLNIITDNGDKIVQGTTCFATQHKHKVDCQRQQCQHWIQHSESQNCVIIASQDGPHTLQKIGQIYGLTRMRICQIEKGIFEKIRKIS